MNLERPDLSRVDPAVRAYIEALEAEIERLRQGSRRAPAKPAETPPSLPDEPPTTLNLVTISAAGLIKRTPRHLYSRQRRGGMGIFDLETPAKDPPVLLALADETDYFFCLTNQARTFRLRLSRLPESPVRSKGRSLNELLPLHPGEQPAVVLPEKSEGYIVLVTRRGHVRRFRHHYFGENLKAGLVLYDIKTLGSPVAGCWSAGEGDLFIATRRGQAIRFAERQVPARGCLGIRLAQGDVPVAVAPITADSGVFLLSADGKGTIRRMSHFRANKAPGSSGKAAMKTDHLAGACVVTDSDDLFIISRLNKIIRFQAVEVPAKEGVVQGVNCISLRGDEATAVINSPMVNSK